MIERSGTEAHELLSATRQRSHSVRGSVFIKSGVEDPAAEFRKAEALFSIAEDCGFEAPVPLSADADAGTMAYRFIPGLQSTRVLYLRHMTARNPGRALLEVFRETGAVLARIHSRLRLDGTVDWRMTAVFEKAFRQVSDSEAVRTLFDAPWVVSHCDFGFSNVNFVERDERVRLVVVDSSPNGFTTFAANLRAPCYVDVANFVNCIEGLVPARWYPLIRWSRLPELRDAFISGYEAESGTDVDRALLASVGYATAASYFHFKFRSAILARVGLHTLFSRFKGNAVTKR